MKAERKLNISLAELNSLATENGWKPEDVKILVMGDTGKSQTFNVYTIPHPDLKEAGWILVDLEGSQFV